MSTKNIWAALAFAVLAIGCKPKTMSEKVENKVEDAAHETGQAVERAGERVQDAAK